LDIRIWWGGNELRDKTPSDSTIDKLLTLYKNALEQYFSIDGTRNVHEFMKLVAQQVNYHHHERFVKWLQEDGIPFIQHVTKYSFPEHQDFISEMEFECFNLEDEMQYEDNSELRSCLINIVSYMPDRLQKSFGSNGKKEY